MIVAMVAVLVVEPTVDNVANMIAVRHSSMSATRSVDMSSLVSVAALSTAGATRGVCAVYWQGMFRNRPVGQHVMQVPVVEVVNVITVLDAGVPALRAMFVVMVSVK